MRQILDERTRRKSRKQVSRPGSEGRGAHDNAPLEGNRNGGGGGGGSGGRQIDGGGGSRVNAQKKDGDLSSLVKKLKTRGLQGKGSLGGGRGGGDGGVGVGVGGAEGGVSEVGGKKQGRRGKKKRRKA